MTRPLIGINCDNFRDARGPITGVRDGYCEAVAAAGGLPVLIPPLSGPAETDRLLDRLDGLVLTGGDDVRPERLGVAPAPSIVPMSPARDRSDFLLLEGLLRRATPTLAICLGFQELNVHLGGTLWQALELEGPPGRIAHRGSGAYHFTRHPVRTAADSRLARLWGDGEREVPSAHHQALRDLAPGLRAVAWAPDGLIEAVELEPHDGFLIGVQWHPEQAPDDPAHRKLFEALIAAALK